MRILLPTGRITEEAVRKAAAGYDATVVVTGELASFLTPKKLRDLLAGGSYDMVITSGMCTASFQRVEEEDRGSDLPRAATRSRPPDDPQNSRHG